MRIEAARGGARLTVHVQPGARRAEIVGAHGDALKCRVRSKAEGGKANRALLALLAEALELPVRRLEITTGASSRRKVIAIADCSPAEVRERLARHLER
ncbi:MAG: hypothetical protein D6776_00905 [Planctomycetota bacterium]|nr:MAG: hypothetical protein D6776_00905 [Planctomycetota bacterium]